MTIITKLPYEIVVRHLLATLSLDDLARMAAVCKFFSELYKDEYLWQIKFLQDYRFFPRPTMCQFGWRVLYRAMMNVEVYTWGCNLDGRLGHGRKYRFNGTECQPKRLRKMDGLPLVQLVSTGWGFHALDKDGQVWGWGRLAYASLRLFDNQPKMLTVPTNVVSLAGGRSVMLAKDRSGDIWQWHWENRPARIKFGPPPQSTRPACNGGASDHHDHSKNHSSNSKNDPVVKMAAGWDLCAVLTASGRLYAWNHHPHANLAQGQSSHHHRHHSPRLKRIYVQRAITLQDQGELGARLANQEGDKFVNVAAGLDFLVAVTGQGYVFKFMVLQEKPSDGSPVPEQQLHNHHSQHYHHHAVGQVVVHGLGLLDYPEAPIGVEIDQLQAAETSPLFPPSVSADTRQQQQYDSDTDDDTPGSRSTTTSSSISLSVICPQAIDEHGVHLAVFSEALKQSIAKDNKPTNIQCPDETTSGARVSAMATTTATTAKPHDHQRYQKQRPSNDAKESMIATHTSSSVEQDPRLQRLRKRQSQELRLLERKHVSHTPLHCSAGYQKFAIFHQGHPLALLGHRHADISTPPTILSRLLDKPCEIAMGDYHQGLLTEDGQLWTWGNFAEGALGHGDLRLAMPIPTMVRGGGLKNKYVFRIACAGWHSGCLAIELPEDGVFPSARYKTATKPLNVSSLKSSFEGVEGDEDDFTGGSGSSDGETLVESSSWSSSSSSLPLSASPGTFESFPSKHVGDRDDQNDYKVEFPRLALTRLCPELTVFDPQPSYREEGTR